MREGKRPRSASRESSRTRAIARKRYRPGEPRSLGPWGRGRRWSRARRAASARRPRGSSAARAGASCWSPGAPTGWSGSPRELPGRRRGARRPHRGRRARRACGRPPRRSRRLHLLVNNAGAGGRASFAEGGWADVHRLMTLNFDAQVRLTEALLPLLRRSAPASIVNVGLRGRPHGAAARGRLLRLEVRPVRVDGGALAGGGAARRARRARPARLHRHGGLHPGAAGRAGADPLAAVDARRRSQRRSSTPARAAGTSATCRGPTAWCRSCACSRRGCGAGPRGRWGTEERAAPGRTRLLCGTARRVRYHLTA